MLLRCEIRCGVIVAPAGKRAGRHGGVIVAPAGMRAGAMIVAPAGMRAVTLFLTILNALNLPRLRPAEIQWIKNALVSWGHVRWLGVAQCRL